MGVLDDAIREHLDLKRKHGATDDEITRQSQEALGPPRRERPQGEDADAAPGDAATAVEESPPRPASEPDESASPSTSDTQRAGDPAPPPGPVLPEQGGNGAQGPAGTSPADAPPDPEPPIPDPTAAPPESGGDPDATMLYEGVGETAPDAEVPAPPEPAPPEPATPEPPAAPDSPPAPEPSEPAVPPEPPGPAEAPPVTPADEQPRDESEPGPAGEDVLEDTPEFLQETPEDERLWFEQKPPRDFDFDD